MLAPAVTYLRVSTKEQATKGGHDEGFSIPAQRGANHAKADTLGASIVKEFVDAGGVGEESRPSRAAGDDRLRQGPQGRVLHRP